MKLVEIRQLKDNDMFKKIIAELNVKGLNNLYFKKSEKIDYLDIIISITDFLEQNKNIFKKLNKENYENLFIIILVQVLEDIDIETNEEQLEKVIRLLKNSLLVQKVSNVIFNKLSILFKKLNVFCCNKKPTHV